MNGEIVSFMNKGTAFERIFLWYYSEHIGNPIVAMSIKGGSWWPAGGIQGVM